MRDDVIAVFRTAMQLDAAFVLEPVMGFQDVPGWDSVGHMNLIGELESRFGITLEMDEIIALDSVGAVNALVERLCPRT